MGGAPAIPIYLHESLAKKMDGRVKSGQDEWAVAARRANQRFGCPVPLAKIFRFTRRANHLYKFAPSHPTRGAYHDRHERGVGCGGRGSVLHAMGSQGESKDS